MIDQVVLAIETSQRDGGVALRDSRGAVHIEALAESKRHDDDLMPAVDRLFARAGLTPGDLSALGISIGPGGFTGLRIAVSTAKMLALALGVRVVAVPSALVAAEGEPEPGGEGERVLVALASKRGTFWATAVSRDAAGSRIVEPEGVTGVRGGGWLADADTVSLDGIDRVLGDRYVPDRLRERCADAGIPIDAPRLDPGACLRLTERMLADGATSDPLTLTPLYPRPPEAVTIWEARGKG